MDSSNLITHFKTNNIPFRIEVEGKESDLKKEGLDLGLDSVRSWANDANKWGCEYRLYFNGNIPNEYSYLTKKNFFYNTDKYAYVINNNELIKDMLKRNCLLGDN